MTLRPVAALVVVVVTTLCGLLVVPPSVASTTPAAHVSAAARAGDVVLTGVVQKYAATTATGDERVLHGLRTSRRTYGLRFDGRVPTAGSRVEVTGRIVEGDVVAVTLDLLGPPTRRALARTGAASHTRVLALRVYWSKKPPARPSAAEARRAMIQRPDAWFEEVSHGRYSLTGDVTPWLRIKPPSHCMDHHRVMARALAKARSRGFDLSAYGRYVVYEPCSTGGVVGMGGMPGDEVWLFGDLSLSVNVHEQGHNLGLDHADARLCRRGGQQVTWSGSCRVQEYGDPSDVMGNRGEAHFNASFKSRLGWLQNGTTLTGGTSNVTLTPAETTGPGVKGVEVRASRNRSYWLELRNGAGFDHPLVTGGRGLQVRLQSGHGSQLLDLMPRSATGFEGTRYVEAFDRMVLPERSAWTTPEGIRISLSSLTARRAEVRVAWGAATPTVPDAPAMLVAAPLENGADLSWEKPDDNGASVLRYLVTASPGGAQKYVEPAEGSVTTTQLEGLEPGVEHTITVRAINEVGTGAGATTGVVPISLGPTVAIASPTAGSTVTGTVPVSADVAPHPVTGAPVTGIKLYVDGRPHTSGWDDAPPWSVDLVSGAVTNGVHTLQVRATAGTGSEERSTMSAPVEVTVRNPALSITSPAAGARLSRTSQVGYTIQDRDAWTFDEVVARVGGYEVGRSVDDGSIDIDVSAVPNGNGTLVLVATDPVHGELRTSRSVVMENPAPTISVTSPGVNQTLTSVEVPVSLITSPSDWPFEYYVVQIVDASGARYVGSADPGEPLVADLSEVPNGSRMLRVVGYWGEGSRIESAAVPVQVSLPARSVAFSAELPPTVSGTVDVPYTLAPADWGWSYVALQARGTEWHEEVGWTDSPTDGTLAWDTTSTHDGTQEVRLVAFDDHDQRYTTDWRSVTLLN